MVYFGSSGKGILVLVIGLSVSTEGISRLLGVFIFNSDSCLMKCSKIRIIDKDHLSFEVGQ